MPVPTPRRQVPNPDSRPTTGGKRRREAGWRAEDRAQAESNWERERRRREVKKASRPRKVQPFRRRAPLPLDLLARSLAAGVSTRQVANDLGISRFDLNRALQQETVRLARDRGEENRRQLRSQLRQAAAAQPPKHQLLSTTTEAVGPGVGGWRRARASRRRPGRCAVHDHPRPAARRSSRCRRVSVHDPPRLRRWPGAAAGMPDAVAAGERRRVAKRLSPHNQAEKRNLVNNALI